jgi:hypothetical protein
MRRQFSGLLGAVVLGLISPLAGWGQQVPDAHPRAPMFELGIGYEGAPQAENATSNLLLQVEARPHFGGSWGAPETTFYRMRLELTAAVSPGGIEIPALKFTFVPVELAENRATSRRDLLATSLGFFPVNGSRDLRLGREGTLRVNVLGYRVETEHRVNADWSVIAGVIVDALGYKLIRAARESQEIDFEGIHLARVAMSAAVQLRAHAYFSVVLAAGAATDSSLGVMSDGRWGYQHDGDAWAELQARIAGYATLFAQIAHTQPFYSLGGGFTPGVLQVLAGARGTF